MASPATPRQAPPPSLSLKELYLVAYNGINALLWAVVLWRTTLTLVTEGPAEVYNDVGQWTKWTQTLAALEIVHSITGVVRAPMMTTLMQVSSRFALVWGAVHFYPEIAESTFYSTMLLAWSFTEVVRYLFFALTLCGISPYPLLWLRYSGFYVLYPVGISSELVELYLAFRSAAADGETGTCIVVAAVMLTYLPGAPVLYTHMRVQRRKKFGGAAIRSSGPRATT